MGMSDPMNFQEEAARGPMGPKEAAGQRDSRKHPLIRKLVAKAVSRNGGQVFLPAVLAILGAMTKISAL